MTLPQKTTNHVWGRDGHHCALCRESVLVTGDNPHNIGEVAHIEGEKPGAARYNPDSTDDQRNGPDNLMLACPTDHTRIDKDEATYTVEFLRQKQKEHIEWVKECLRTEVAATTFAELEVIIRYVVGTEKDSGEDYSLIKPAEKISKNELSVDTSNLITMGLARAGLVGEYLNDHPDISFGERLRNGLSAKYNELKAQGLSGDEIYEELLRFASGDSPSFGSKAAAMCVIAYFFERCDIFEK